MNRRSQYPSKRSRDIVVEKVSRTPVALQRTEIVERKGVGHPDTICDAVHEAISLALCRAYRERCGRVLHHNIDKGLLVAGRSEPCMGGGRILEPMRLVVGDRATAHYAGNDIDVDAIVKETVHRWWRGHLRFVDVEKHLVVQNELRQGAVQLSDIFERQILGANDTSAAVGYAPLTETERMVLEAERFLNSAAFKERFPETGEDVKVMGCRLDKTLMLTVAMAFVDCHVPDERFYFDRKSEIERVLAAHLSEKRESVDRIEVTLNALDRPERGAAGMYLTVLGTSAEGADCGQVGRGNRANGLIALNRPSGNEAAAGKNPTIHVGKIYSALTHRMAEAVCREVPGLTEVYVWLCSRIGSPIDEPVLASVQVATEKGVSLRKVAGPAREIVAGHLEKVSGFTDALAEGTVCVY